MQLGSLSWPTRKSTATLKHKFCIEQSYRNGRLLPEPTTTNRKKPSITGPTAILLLFFCKQQEHAGRHQKAWWSWQQRQAYSRPIEGATRNCNTLPAARLRAMPRTDIRRMQMPVSQRQLHSTSTLRQFQTILTRSGSAAPRLCTRLEKEVALAFTTRLEAVCSTAAHTETG